MYALAEVSKSVDTRLVQGCQKPESGLHRPTHILKYKQRECCLPTSAVKETFIIWGTSPKFTRIIVEILSHRLPISSQVMFIWLK
jgi:hypothetical protein